MKKLMFVTLGVAALAIGSQPVTAQAQVADAIQAVNDAIVELTDAPALGKRTTVDVTKRWGSDRSVIDSATAKLQDGLSKAQSGGVGADAMRQLETLPRPDLITVNWQMPHMDGLELTRRIRANVDHWIDLRAMSDDAAAAAWFRAGCPPPA